MPTDDESHLDILRGVPAIAAFVCLNERQTYHALQHGHIRAIKEGATWVTTKTRLRDHYNGANGEERDASNSAARCASLAALPSDVREREAATAEGRRPR